MQTFETGQRTLLAQLSPDFDPAARLTLRAEVAGAGTYDLTLFGLNEEGQLLDERYAVSQAQPVSPAGELRVWAGAGHERLFEVQLSQLPPTVRRLSVVLTVQPPASLSAVEYAAVTISAGGRDLMTYRVSAQQLQAQRALMLLDLYDRGGWRAAAVGQGFSGGLDALLAHFGRPRAQLTARKPASVPAPVPALVRPPASAAPVQVLRRPGDSVQWSLLPTGSVSGGMSSAPVRAQLSWLGQALNAAGGAAGAEVDLDLGCMFALHSGEMGVVQALGQRFGSAQFSPYILLDSRTPAGAGCQTETLTLFRPDLVHTAVIFAFVYSGAGSLDGLGVRLDLTGPGGLQATMTLDGPSHAQTFCALAALEGAGTAQGASLQITKEELYFRDHQACDLNYGFGFQWGTGTK